jgi:hypothetical protein
VLDVDLVDPILRALVDTPIKTVSVKQSVRSMNPAPTTVAMSEDLFNDGLKMQSFIYEEPKPAYWKSKNRLDSLGAFSRE